MKLLDAVAEDMTKEDVCNFAQKHKPDIIVLDSTTPSIYSDIDYAKNLKKSIGCTIVMVGPHASALPRETLQLAKNGVDIICRGEYDYTILDVVRSMESNTNLEEVKGISYWDHSQIKETEDRPFIADLDELPFPAWHHLDLHKYYNPSYINPFTDIVSGRGCPFRCTFCLWPQVMHGRRYRLRSVSNIVDEMEYDVDNWPFLRELFFEDDTLTANKKYAKKICEEILKRKLEVTWSCNSRCDVLDLDLLKLMKKAGCRMLLIGPESGCQRILDNVKKGLTLDTVRRFVGLAKKAGLQLHACYVIGLPGETNETIEMTIKFAKELDTEQIQVSAAIPFVGTEFYDWTVKRGYLKANDWSEYLQEGEQTSVVEYPWLSGKTINEAVDRLLFKYYFHPKHVFRLLIQTRSVDDLSRKVKGALNLLDYYLTKMRKNLGISK